MHLGEISLQLDRAQRLAAAMHLLRRRRRTTARCIRLGRAVVFVLGVGVRAVEDAVVHRLEAEPAGGENLERWGLLGLGRQRAEALKQGGCGEDAVHGVTRGSA